MAVETSSRVVTFESRPDAGLHALVLAAVRAVTRDEFDAGGLLELVPLPAEDAPAIRIEASLSDDGLRSSIAQLDVHLSVEVGRVDAALVREATAAFGGTDYTNLCVAGEPQRAGGDEAGEPRRGEDALDVTVTFPGGWPLYARNRALVRPDWSAAERTGAAAALRALGVGARWRPAGVAVGGHQLRRRLTSRAQADAFVAAVEHGLFVALYTARIPPSSSLRLAASPGATGSLRLEACVSHGLIADRLTTEADALAIQRFAERHFAFRPAARPWQVTSRTWSQDPSARAGEPDGARRRRG